MVIRTIKDLKKLRLPDDMADDLIKEYEESRMLVKQSPVVNTQAQKKKTETYIPDYIWTGVKIPIPTREFRFAPPRRWRLDYAWFLPGGKLAVEIEGGAWTMGRHVRGKGFLGDMEKYNALAIDGWRLLRYTPTDIRYFEIRDVIEQLSV
jgi:hypothetical protein